MLKEMEVKTVLCKNLGKVPDSYAIAVSVMLNVSWTDIQILKLAEVINTIDNVDLKRVIYSTRYSLTDVKNLLTLMSFDWRKFDIKSDETCFMKL